MTLADWFLTAVERGNDATELVRRHSSGAAWTAGNDVRVHVDGADYFTRPYEVLCATRRGAWIH